MPLKCQVCEMESSLRCSNCGQAVYCGVDHQRADWASHRVNCVPFRVAQNELLGRHLIATRDLKVGDLVLKEKPIICGPSQITSPVCLGCLQGLVPGQFVVCPKCGWPLCSVNCSSKSDHFLECEMTQRKGSKVSIKDFVSPHPMYQCLLTMRCMMLRDKNPKKWAQLNELESHCAIRKDTVQWKIDRECIAKFILRYFKPENWTEDDILRMTGITQINGHEVPITEPPNISIYRLASLVEHSCRPNLAKSFSAKGEIVLWAPIAIRKGDHLSICYSDSLWGTMQRREHLWQTKMFHCECERCQDVTEFGTFYSAVKCSQGSNKNCDGLVLPDTLANFSTSWKCRKCKSSVDFEGIRKILDNSYKDLMESKESVADCERYLKQYSQYFPSSHFHMCEMKGYLAQKIGGSSPAELQSISTANLQKKIGLSKDVLEIYEAIAPAENRSIGAVMFDLHAALAEYGRRAVNDPKIDCLGALVESLHYVTKCVSMLQREPILLAEGQICKQARINMESLQLVLRQRH